MSHFSDRCVVKVGRRSAAKVGQPIPAELSIGYVLIGLLNRPISLYKSSITITLIVLNGKSA